jgi:hypothetical protein
MAMAVLRRWGDVLTHVDSRSALGAVFQQLARRRRRWSADQLLEASETARRTASYTHPFEQGRPYGAILTLVERTYGGDVPPAILRELHEMCSELGDDEYGIYAPDLQLTERVGQLAQSPASGPTLADDPWAELVRAAIASSDDVEASNAVVALAASGSSGEAPKRFEREARELAGMFGTTSIEVAPALVFSVTRAEAPACRMPRPHTGDVLVGLVWFIGATDARLRLPALESVVEWGWTKIPNVGAPSARAARAAAMTLARERSGAEILGRLASSAERSPSAQEQIESLVRESADRFTK